MSSFTALNLSDDELDIEEHTRELQIEIALNTLNKALEFQKSSKFDKAHLKYDELGRIEILQQPNISNNPTINRLKYLYCRNRGMLRLRELIDRYKLKQKKIEDCKIEEKTKTDSEPNIADGVNRGVDTEKVDGYNVMEIDSSDESMSGEEANDDELEISVYGEIIGSINDLLNATVYGIPDVKIVQILSSLFNHFGHPRLARLCYEMKLNTAEDSKTNDDLKIDLNRPDELLFNQVNLLENFMSLLDEISDNTSILYHKVERCLRSKKFWNEVRHDGKHSKYNWDDILTIQQWNNERLREPDNLVLDVIVTDEIVDLNSLLDEILNCVPKPKGKSRMHDGYQLTKSIFAKVELEFDIGISPEIEESEAITEDRSTPIATSLDPEVEPTILEETDKIDAKETTESKPKDVIASRATRSARTKPDIDSSNDYAKTKLKNYDIFISQTLPSFLKLCGIEPLFRPLSELVSNGIEYEVSGIDKNISLFYSCLASWEDEYTQCLTVTDEKRNRAHSKSTPRSESESESIREIVNLKSAKVINPHLFERKNMTELYQFLLNLSKKNMHFNQVRTAIVKFIFESNPSTGTSVMCVEPMTKKTVRNFKIILDCVSFSLYNEFEHFTLYELSLNANKKMVISKFNISVSIFEVLVDSYVEFIQDQKLKKTSTYKQTLASLQNFENTIVKRIEKWREIIEDAFAIVNYHDIPELAHIWSRFVWFRLYYLQSHSQILNPQELTDVLSELSEVVESKGIYLPFVNYELIPVLNYENIQTQSSKLKILEIFDKNEESNKILESVLLKKKLELCDDNIEIRKIQTQFENFVGNSNLPLKLRLWSLLLRYYRLSNDILAYKNAFEHIIELMINQLKPENTQKLSDHDSKILILNVLGFFCHFSQKFINFCNTANFECFDRADRESSVRIVQSISYILYMLYSFPMYQNAVQIDARTSLSTKSSKSFEILCNCVSSCFFLLAFYFPSALIIAKQEYIADFVSVCHIELGSLHMCSTIDGAFLKYAQYKLTNLDFSIAANDVFQIIHCRFGLSISLDGFETYDHKCKPRKLTIDDTTQLSKFVSTYCFKGKHPVISPPRNDIKSIIDKIVDVVGDPDPANLIVANNKKLLDSYLSGTNISLQFVIDSFQGKSDLKFKKPDVPGIQVAENGLYYIEGLIGLHFFKVRRRTMQSRAAELDYVLKMLENDILCGCNRFENWVALGQTYSFLVEDDLIWTADKLNSVERKQMTSLTQKRALLCYIMAICLHFSSSEEEKARHSPVTSILWESFAKELYGAWMEPMNKKAFHIFVDDDSENSKTNTNESSSKLANIKSQPNNIPNNAIFKLLELAFKSAVHGDETNWYDLMYLAKSQCKLRYQNTEPSRIIENLLKSCDVALKQSSKDDPIIEPHYYLFSTISKLYKLSMVSFIEAQAYLRRDALFTPLFSSEIPEKSFESLTFKVLNKIIVYDKKNWQHRPVYRLAQSYYEIEHDIEHAKKELLTLINLKPNIRSLSTIWKPTSERPGKHFIYNSVYTQFLVQLLYENGDIYSLTILLKKMRRAGSIMVNLTKTFDNMMLRICILIKKSLDLSPGFLDDSISKLRFSDFTKYSAEFVEHLGTILKDQFDEETALHLYFLSETQTFRKLATGFGATGLIDECYHSIYIKLFLPFLFDKLIINKNEGLLNKKLLNTAKDFTVEKLVRSKQPTPDIATKLHKSGSESESVELRSTAPISDIHTEDHNLKVVSQGTMPDTSCSQGNGGLVQVQELFPDELTPLSASSLSTKERYAIINYLSFGKTAVTGTPSKEKIRVARRDISPFALKVVNATQALVNSIKENTNDGETIDYKISRPLDNTEFEKAIVGVMVKETKENKEEKEFDELISAHDRSFTEDELADFNQILGKFEVTELSNTQTKIEVENLENAQERKHAKDAEVELQRLRVELNRDNDISEASTEGTRNGTPVPSGLDDAKINNLSDAVLGQAEEYNPFASPLKDDSQFAHQALTNSENITKDKHVVEHNKGSMVKNLTHDFNATGDSNPNSDENTQPRDELLLSKNSEQTPTKTIQSIITNFFKISPTKSSPLPSNGEEKLGDKRKLENQKTPDSYDDYKKARLPERELESRFLEGEDRSNLQTSADNDLVPSPSRRHSKRGSTRSTLLELGESGGAMQQVDIKQQRENTLLKNAESLSSSSSSSSSSPDTEQSVIIID